MTDRPTRLPALVTKPMSWVYGLGAAYKARRFDAGRGIVRLDRPVISIGNLSAGGTGKTPMVHHVVRVLREAGHHPVIAMRGYKAEPGTLGDEAMEHRSVFPDIPLVAQPDRVAGLRALFATGEGKQIDCVVLDDGFQHRRIARDLDIVLIDASRPVDRDALLPHGFLREPVSALARADAMVVTHTEMVEAAEVERMSGWLQEHAGQRPLATAHHHWANLDVHEGDSVRPEETGWLAGKRVMVVCAIANPGGLINGVEQQGAVVAGSIVLADHEIYNKVRIKQINRTADEADAEVLLTTQKDWVKLCGLGAQISYLVVVPRLRLGFGEAGAKLDGRIVEVVELWFTGA